MKSTTLYYREGSSDKVYQASIEPKDAGFVVNFAYGRRGSTLNTGTKTSIPVDEQTATRIFEKLIIEKKSKGYSEGPDGTPYLHSEKQVSGITPQLLNPIEEEELPKYLDDPNWCMQQKLDGKRLLLRKTGAAIEGINRKGLVVGIPASIHSEAMTIQGDFLMDGEIIGDTYYVFDLLSQKEALSHLSYAVRYDKLAKLLKPHAQQHIKVVLIVLEADAKRDSLQALRLDRAEGVVFKALGAPYTPGRPASGGSQLKHKFYATGSFVVSGTNKSKRSVRLILFDEVCQKEAGNVTIPPNHPIPTIGDVVEVRYLYAFPESGCVYQPVYLGKRDDVMPSDCSTKQLKLRRPDEEEADQ